MANQHTLQAPTGTRDFYPAELGRLRYIQKAWRDVSIRHGFEEIDGPTFEHLDLYTIKSGEGIVSELFSFQRAGGEKTYALRPEFTPTLARLFADRASTLPRPTKWFWAQNCFRAERPQRGRLREFCQWNIDFLGDDSPMADAETLACCIDLLRALGLGPEHVRVKISHRLLISSMLTRTGVPEERLPQAFELIDKRDKLGFDEFVRRAQEIGMSREAYEAFRPGLMILRADGTDVGERDIPREHIATSQQFFGPLFACLRQLGVLEWCEFDNAIVRGLAYYTGMVFEVHEASGAERAIAGGGRYDKLIELFGGPPTPAVGFGMGDVVLSLVLQDKGLMPTDEQIAAALGQRPDIFVISSGSEAADAAAVPLVALLRRDGLHARRSYKTTKNIGKLLKDAVAAHARFAAIIEQDGRSVTVKNLDTGAQGAPLAIANLVAAVRG